MCGVQAILILKTDSISKLWWRWVAYVLRSLFVEATSRRSRWRKLSPPSRPKLSSIVLVVLKPLPHQARSDSLALCVVLWTSRCFESHSLVRVSPRALASRLRLACNLVPGTSFCSFWNSPQERAETKKGEDTRFKKKVSFG